MVVVDWNVVDQFNFILLKQSSSFRNEMVFEFIGIK